MVTPEQKDALLIHLIEIIKVGDLQPVSRRQSIMGFDKNEISGMLTQFHEMRLIHIDNLDSISGFFRVLMRVDAHDFIREGGFYGRYELFQKNVEKLLYQVERLEKIEGPQQEEVKDIGKQISDYLGLISNMTTIGSSVIAVVKPSCGA